LHFQFTPWAACSVYLEVLPLARETNKLVLVLGTLWDLAECHVLLGEYDRADELCREGIGLALNQGNRGYTAWFIGHFGRIAAKTGKPRRAARLLGAGEALWLSLHDPQAAIRAEPFPHLETELGLYPETVAEEWMQGRSMSWDQVVEYALKDPKQDQ
jgi:hypothetical protein